MIGIRLELRIAAPSNPKIVVLIRFGEFCIQNYGRFSEGAAALDDINVQKIKKWYQWNLTGQEMIGIRLELRILAPSNPKIAVLIWFGEFCIQNDGRFFGGISVG